MSPPIELKAKGLNVRPLREALEAHPELWDQNTGRTAPEDSPHHGCSDIWMRYAPPGTSGAEPHRSVWYEAAKVIPEIKEMAYGIMSALDAAELAGVLVTRIPPGGEVKPHEDHGWHASSTEKWAVSIKAEPGQVFCFDGHELETEPGDVFTFRNDTLHWVKNPTEHERITAIFCIRR